MIITLDVDEIIPKSTRMTRNKKRSWRPGYLADYDVINISRDGTIGDVVDVQGLRIAIPSKPYGKRATEFLNHDKPKKDQMWERDELPEIAPEDEWRHAELIDKYLDRLDYRTGTGVWIYRNGEATWISPIYYFYLQFIRLDEGFPEYREPDREYFYFVEACIFDRRCLGSILLKSRRQGATYKSVAIGIYLAISIRDSHVGTISKSGEDAAALFKEKTVPAWISLWGPLKPEYMRRSDFKKDIEIRPPTVKSQKEIEDGGMTTVGHNSFISWRNTALRSYDSMKILYMILDEGAKWPKNVPVDKYFLKIRPAMKKGTRIVGKFNLMSTQERLKLGGKGYKTLWEQSDVKTRLLAKNTASGLYRFFLPAQETYEGCFDAYGNVVIDEPKTAVYDRHGNRIEHGSRWYIENIEYAGAKDADELSDKKREFPMVIEDAFREPSGTRIFSMSRLNDQMAHNDISVPPPVRYSLTWLNGIRKTKVVAKPDPDGRFYFDARWALTDALKNNVRENGSRYEPMNFGVGAGGVDPYNNDYFDDEGRYSNGAMMFKTRALPTSSDTPSNRFFLEYIDRPSTADEFYEDCLKAAWFCGMPILMERSSARMENFFDREGCVAFLLRRPKGMMPKNERDSLRERKRRGLPSTKDVNSDLANIHAAWIMNNVGKVDSDSDAIHENISFDRSLNDWYNFELDERTKFDATVAAQLCIVATSEAFAGMAHQEVATAKTQPIMLPVGARRR